MSKNNYTIDFKLNVVKDIKDNYLSLSEASLKYSIGYTMIRKWYKIYLTEGAEALGIERRGRKKGDVITGRPPKIKEEIKDDLIAENERLRMENAYLKKLNALVQAKEK